MSQTYLDWYPVQILFMLRQGLIQRDENKNTEDGRGLDVEDCRKMLAETGFSRILMGDGKSKPISF